MTNATKENILRTASMYREYHDNYPCDLSLGKTAMRSMRSSPTQAAWTYHHIRCGHTCPSVAPHRGNGADRSSMISPGSTTINSFGLFRFSISVTSNRFEIALYIAWERLYCSNVSKIFWDFLKKSRNGWDRIDLRQLYLKAVNKSIAFRDGKK